MDIGDGAVALFVDVADQALHAVHIVGHYGGAVIKIVVEGDHGDLGENQLLNQGIVEIRADDGDAVHTAVERMLQIAGALLADVGADKGDVIAAALGFGAEAVQGRGEVLVHKAAVLQIGEQDAEIKGAVGFEGAGCGIGCVAQFLRGSNHALTCRFADVRRAVERFADRRCRDAALKRDVLHGNHNECPLT